MSSMSSNTARKRPLDGHTKLCGGSIGTPPRVREAMEAIRKDIKDANLAERLRVSRYQRMKSFNRE